jgi:hypothetical protein
MKSVCQCRFRESAWNSPFSNATIALITLFSCAVSAADDGRGVGYRSVKEARHAVTRFSGVVTKAVDGWLIVEIPEDKTTWIFPEKGEVGYPSVIRRRVVESAGKVEIETRVLCEAKEIACNELVKRFTALDRQIRERVADPPEGG